MNQFICYDRCGTCKKAEAFLKEQGIAFEKRPIVEENPKVDELGRWIAESGLPSKRFFNTSGNVYKDLKLKDKLPEMSLEEQIDLLSTNGMLVKRPILLHDKGVLVGFKQAEWEEALLGDK